ncbi:MAG: cobyrinate a,c-diamide synthase [Chlorobiaceae bacterium]|nr:cobyrinate a,c-diamide synthase [Chlorobiaceae bacterium]
MISASWKSAGKTTVSLGLLRLLAEKGLPVVSFKKGPDYIDPMWHRVASGSECYNLDTWMMGGDACRETFARGCALKADSYALVEGNHGLHDGMDMAGSDSSAGLADLLGLPVLLVVDGRRVNRGVAAQVLGLQAMPPKVRIAGVILNHVASSRQESKQRQAIETFCKVPVLGAIPSDASLLLPERHLGLVTVAESPDAEAFIRSAAEQVERHCDLDAITALFQRTFLPPFPADSRPSAEPSAAKVKIGVFRDAAFCFYYPDNLDALRCAGAVLVFIDTFSSGSLPDIDGLYIGGGFPESFFEELSGNTGLSKDVRERIEAGMPAWAECGGLIWLCRSATRDGRRWPLAGVLPVDIDYQRKPVGCGYLELESRENSAWFLKGERLRAHEFHYSKPADGTPGLSCQFDVLKGFGLTGRDDGILYRNLFASYAHFHAAANPHWAERFFNLASRFQADVSSEIAV